MKSRSLAAATLALVALLTTATAALGDSDLIASDPADGSTLTTTPYTLTLMFDEPLEPNSNVLVRDSGGAEVARGGVSENNGAVLEVQLPELPDGEYVARWTASSADGHSVRGTVNFTIEAAATPTASEAAPPSPSATPSDTPTAASSSPAPTASPAPVDPASGPTSSSDLLIALLVAALAIAGVVGFLLVRGRR